jgi:hypothetical protein
MIFSIMISNVFAFAFFFAGTAGAASAREVRLA